MSFVSPSSVTAPTRTAGGDNEVPRDGRGAPRIVVDCWTCNGAGGLFSEKTGRLIRCTGRCGERKDDPPTKGLLNGKRLKSYTRTTTFIDVLDDKSNLDAWNDRMVLVGVATDPTLLDGVYELHQDFLKAERKNDEDGKRKAKDELNRRAEVAKAKAGANDKSEKGTELHGLSELVDMGEPLPPGIAFGDVIDMDAYRRATTGLKIVHMEKLVVNDELQVGGTPDRVSEWASDDTPLVAPNGHEFRPGELLITDLKTGTVQYGALKMAMQLALYSRSKLYDWQTGERTPLGNINQDWGIIMNVPAGSGEAYLYWADLDLGWRAVQLAKMVREIRRDGRKALTLLQGGGSALAA